MDLKCILVSHCLDVKYNAQEQPPVPRADQPLRI